MIEDHGSGSGSGSKSGSGTSTKVMPNDIIDILPDLGDLHEEAEGEEIHEVEDESELDGDAENEAKFR